MDSWTECLLAATDATDRIARPTLVMAGELDVICGPAQARPIARSIRGSRLAVLPGCGHIPSVEAPERYRQVVVGFLSR